MSIKPSQCHPAISSSVVPFSSCLQSFPASVSFPISQFFASGAQSIGVSASASVLPMTIQGWFPLGQIGWISLQTKKLMRVLDSLGLFSNTTVQKHRFFGVQLSLWFNASLVAQTVAMRETGVRFLDWEDPLKKEMASHSSTLAWKIPRTEEPDRLQSMESQRVGHYWATSLSLHLHPYMTTGKTRALTRRTFIRKVMSLLFNRLSRFVIAFLPF